MSSVHVLVSSCECHVRVLCVQMCVSLGVGVDLGVSMSLSLRGCEHALVCICCFFASHIISLLLYNKPSELFISPQI